MSARGWSAAALLLMGLCPVLGQAQEQTVEQPVFDAAAEIAAASSLPEPSAFKRLWTSKQRMRPLHGLAISGDGTRVMALLPDGAPVIYDGNSGEELCRLAKPGSWVLRSALSPDGAHAAVGLMNGEVILFQAKSGEIQRRYNTSKTEVNALHFGLAGTHLVWLHEDGNLVQAKLDEAQPQVEQINSGRDPRWFAFNPGGERVFVGLDSLKGTFFTKLFGSPPAQVQVDERKFLSSPELVTLADQYFAFYNNQGRLILEAFNNAGATHEPRRFTLYCNLTADVQSPKALAASSNGASMIGVGRGQVEIRFIDCPLYPSIHNADLGMAAQVSIAPDKFRIAAVDGDGFLTVLGMAATSEPPAWRFLRVLKQLVLEERFEDLDKLGEAIQEDPESFPFEAGMPKYQALVENVLVNRNLLQPQFDAKKIIKRWREARPESTLARLKEIDMLVEEGWEARGSGYASTVSPEAFETFHLRLLEASKLLEPLLEVERPAPYALYSMLAVAKGESRGLRERMHYVEKLMEISPRFENAHVMSVENLLPRWGGAPHSSAEYAAKIADQIGGLDGDAMYARLAITIATYEGEKATALLTGIDFERAIRGAEHMQETPHLRPLGALYELRLADVNDDEPRVTRVIARIHQEKLPFVHGAVTVRYYYEHLYRTYLGQPVPE